MVIVNDFEPKKIFNMDLCKKIELVENGDLYSLVIHFIDGTTELIAESDNQKEITKKFEKIVSIAGDLIYTRSIRWNGNSFLDSFIPNRNNYAAIPTSIFNFLYSIGVK